jgi:TetR/AcrR family transcriptional regulator, transcriptional repressor for nem operon
VLGRFIAETGGETSRGEAMAILATMVGAVTLSRVVNDPDLAQALLDAAAEQVRDTAASKIAPQDTETLNAQRD